MSGYGNPHMAGVAASVVLGPEVLEQVAQRVAAILAERSPSTASPFMSPTEAADYLRCDRRRIYRMCDDGRLVGVKDGGRLLVERASVEGHVASR